MNRLITFALVVVSFTALAGNEPPAKDTCHTPGLANSYTLAFTWQPAFCESHKKKAECRNGGQSSGFTLHGLWPNSSDCGRNYSYCGDVRKNGKGMCGNPPVSLSQETRQALVQRMPGAIDTSCLDRHEWFKHGTCQTRA